VVESACSSRFTNFLELENRKWWVDRESGKWGALGHDKTIDASAACGEPLPMNHRIPTAILALVWSVIPLPAEPPATADETTLEASNYAFGYQTGAIFREDFAGTGLEAADLRSAPFWRGFMKAVEGGDLTDEEEKEISEALQKLQAVLEKRGQALAKSNKAAELAFLKENGAREGVTTLPAGLQYEVIQPGSGEPGGERPGIRFLVRFEGRLLDGSPFTGGMEEDALEFPLDVLPGVREALIRMPAGAHWKVWLPAALAYGDEGIPGLVPPASCLVFDLKLEKVITPQENTEEAP